MSHIISVTGRVGRKDEVKAVGDNHVLNFSLASTEFGGKEKGTIWFNCAKWGQHGVNIADWVTVGKQLTVTGRLTVTVDGNPQTYTAKDGSTRASYNLTVDNIEFLGSRSDGDGNSEEEKEDDLPF